MQNNGNAAKRLTLAERDEAAQENLIRYARLYARGGGQENWIELCRAKATLDALRRLLPFREDARR
ncbi:MAG: hypothetical protein JWO85_2651 [Candidatus Eremiobacteraeota bacterium]|nr:hypothetical protein [Candidatus Eremiobacteraeota bacterium]